MPQADHMLTVSFETPPTGIFSDASSPAGVLEAAQIRMGQIGDLLFLLKSSECLPRAVQHAIGAIETMVADTAALLDVRAA